jgi:secretory phospholipase A2
MANTTQHSASVILPLLLLAVSSAQSTINHSNMSFNPIVLLCLFFFLLSVSFSSCEIANLEGLLNQFQGAVAGRKAAKNNPSPYFHHPHYPDSCPTYPCDPATHQAIIHPTYKATSNGCGAYGMQITAAQDEFKFTPACDIHDICYGTCNSDRSKCDAAFLKDMHHICNRIDSKSNRDQFNRCKETAKTYHQMGKIFGCSTYAASQKEACHCQKKSNQGNIQRDL